MITEDERAEIHRLIKEGVAKQRVAKIMGRSKQTIYDALKRRPDPVYIYKEWLRRTYKL